MEEVQSLTEDLRLMIHFDPEALTGMQTAEALLQPLKYAGAKQGKSASSNSQPVR